MHVFCATSLPFDADAHKLMRPRRRFSQRLNGRRVSAVREAGSQQILRRHGEKPFFTAGPITSSPLSDPDPLV